MNINQSFTDNKKIISNLGAFVIFVGACYLVFTFINQRDATIVSLDQEANTIIRPEIVAYLQSVDIQRSFLKDKSIMNSEFVKNMKDFSEIIDTLYPKGRNNPFLP